MPSAEWKWPCLFKDEIPGLGQVWNWLDFDLNRVKTVIFCLYFEWTLNNRVHCKGPVTQALIKKTRTIKMHALDWLNKRGGQGKKGFKGLKTFTYNTNPRYNEHNYDCHSLIQYKLNTVCISKTLRIHLVIIYKYNPTVSYVTFLSLDLLNNIKVFDKYLWRLVISA